MVGMDGRKSSAGFVQNLPFFPTTLPRTLPGCLRVVWPTPYQPRASLLNLNEGAQSEGRIRVLGSK